MLKFVKNKANHYQRTALRILLVGLPLLLFFGCAGNSGSLQPDPKLGQMFYEHRLVKNYQYYYMKNQATLIAVMGIDKRYKLVSKIWQPAHSDRQAIREINTIISWGVDSSLDSDVFNGYDIHDTAANQVGVLYATCNRFVVKMLPDHRIQVIYLQNPNKDILKYIRNGA